MKRAKTAAVKRGQATKGMAKWKAWLVIGVMTGVTGFLVWLGLAIVVRSDRVEDDRIDVTVERRLLGLLPVSTESVRDVVNADIYVVSGRSGSGPRSRTGTMALQLTTRDGSVSRRTRFGPAFGTQPNVIAEEIQQLITDRARPSFTRWWMPWVVNIGAVPFVLVVGAIWGSVLLRALGFLKPEPTPADGNP